MTDARVPENSGEARMEAALKPFGWTCGPEFWQRYYTDPWVFNLANAVEKQAAVLDELADAREQWVWGHLTDDQYRSRVAEISRKHRPLYLKDGDPMERAS